jgi:hypothetical protein
MTPADEARFIALWNSGTETAAIAQAFGIPLGTVSSRAATLVRQGKIQARPKGGAFPHQQARQERAPAPPAPQLPPAPPAMTFVAVPEIQEILSVVKDLQARVISLEQTRVISLEQTRVPPALPATPAPPTAPVDPAPPAAERKDIQQWTVRLSKALIEHLKAVAYERRIPPSQLVEELVWKALMDHHPSTPSSASTPDRTSSWTR